ncbi:prepilin-type N-terminal cleavage/methylation domain-containing protein [bacterium]|nr:prepilin-type N-terminal cleavage/methylation domain-containing protein [bacterium]
MSLSYNDYNGFTFIELLTSMVILVIGILGICGLHYAALSGNKTANQITLAVTLAEQKIEELKRLGYANSELSDTDGVKTDVDINIKQNPALFTDPDHGNDSPVPGMTRVWNIADDTPSPGLKTLTVIVGWEEKRWHYMPTTTIIRSRDENE